MADGLSKERANIDNTQQERSSARHGHTMLETWNLHTGHTPWALETQWEIINLINESSFPCQTLEYNVDLFFVESAYESVRARNVSCLFKWIF